MIYLELFYTFFTIGLFSFGGGHAMIPMIQNEVISKGWATLETVIDFIAVSESTPGPFAVNLATFIGNNLGGIFGAVVATVGVTLPSFIIILIIARSFSSFKDNIWVKRAFLGLKPAVLGLIAYAAATIIKSGIKLNFAGGISADIKAVIIFLTVTFMAFKFKKLHPTVLIIMSVLLGILFYGVL